MGLSAITIGGIVAGIGAAAGGAISAGVSARNTRKTNELNYQIFQEQQQFNQQQTDPAYIRQRQEEAGYNAALLANGNALGQAASSGNAPQMQTADLSGFGSGLQQAVNTYMAYKQTESDINLKNAQAEQVHIENQYRTQEAMARINKMIEETDSTSVKRQLDEILSRYQDRIYQSELQQTQEHINYIKEQTRGQITENLMNSVRLSYLPEIMRLDIANAASDIAIKKQTMRLNEQQLKNMISENARIIAQTHLYNEQQNTQEQLTSSATTAANVAKRTEDYNVTIIEAEMWNAINNAGPDSMLKMLYPGPDFTRSGDIPKSPSGYYLKPMY